MLKIERPKENVVLGSTLKVGDTFKYINSYYIVPGLQPGAEMPGYAVHLETGERMIHADKYVIPVNLITREEE